MRTKRVFTGLATISGALILSGGSALAQPVIDGVNLDATDYGPALWFNDVNPTAFGDNNLPQAGNANGSEIDGVYAFIGVNGLGEDTLFIGVTGNLETNFNKLDLFFDYDEGVGQNRLRGDNPDIDFNGLNRMGDDGNGNGLTFDAPFTANAYLTFTTGNYDCKVEKAEIFANFADLDLQIGSFLGQTVTGESELTGGDNPFGIALTINNSNVDGVTSNSTGGSDEVTTGMEIAIPLSAFGDPAGAIRIVGFINGGGHDFLSNQILGGSPDDPGTNLGEPRAIDFELISGDQFITVN